MALDMIYPLLVLAFTASFTPGPNNALVAASGAKFGLYRTLPHIAGIGIGFSVMVFFVGLFLGRIFEQSLWLREALRWAGAALLLYVSFKIITTGGLGSENGEPRPFTFLESAGFQWVNPKGWAMSIAITSQFVTPDRPILSALIVAVVFVLMGFSSATAWTLAGTSLRQFLNTEVRIRVFNLFMGATIAACVLLLFVDL